MPQPAAGDRHVNSLLTNFSLLSMQDAAKFVAPKVCPIIRVAKQSDYYAVYTDSFFRRNTMAPRARASVSAGGGFEIDNTNTYFCDKYALHVNVADDDRRNADSVFEIDSEVTTYLTHQAMLNMEKDFASTIFATSTWTGSSTGSDITPSTAWDNASGKPIKEIKAQMTSVQKKTGQRPNVLIVGRDTWDKGLAENADVLARIKHTSFGVATPDLVAQACELEAVYIADAINTTSAEGASTETTAYINTTDDALLLYVPKNPGRMTPCAAATFIWTGDNGMGLNDYGAAVKKFRMEELEADRVEINQYFDIKQTSANMGAYFDGVLT
jgi:hypothetical protein